MASENEEEILGNSTFNNENSKILLQAGVNFGNFYTANDPASNPELRVQAGYNYGHTFNFTPRKVFNNKAMCESDAEELLIYIRVHFRQNQRKGEIVAIDKCFKRCFSESAAASTPAICAITGTGGMGKTQTALEYAYACQEKHHLTAVFWVLTATEESIQTSFVSIMQSIVEEQARVSWPESAPDYNAVAHSLGISGLVDKASGKVSFDPEAFNSIQVALFNWLKLPGNCRWLFVFDNADDLSFNIDKYFPAHGSGGILVTSRRREFAHCAEQLDLDGLDRESSTSLLLRLAQLPSPTEDDRKHATTVVEKLGFMPLAISHAGSFIHEMNISVDKYMDYYDKAFREAQSQIPKLGWAYRNDTAVTTWEVSFLAVQQQDKAAALLLLACSYLNPNEIFERLWEDDGQADVKVQLQLKNRFSLLSSYSLINRNQPGAFSIHPVVHDWARERVSDVGRFLPMMSALEAIGSVLRRKVFLKLKGMWDLGDDRMITAHALVLCKYLGSEFMEHAQNTNEFLERITDINRIASTLQSQGRYDEALKQYQKVLNWKKSNLGENHLETLITASNIAHIFNQQGRYEEALEKYQSILARRGAVDVKSLDPETVGILNEETLKIKDYLKLLYYMAISLYNLGRYNEALELFQEVLIGREKVVGRYHWSTLSTMSNIATILSEQGRPAEAMKQYQRILASQERNPQRDEQSILITMNNIAVTLNKLGRFEDALEYHRRVLAGMEKVLDPDHPSIFSTIRDIGSVLSNLDKYTEALEWYYKALNGLERVLGPEHPRTLTVAGQIATVFQSQGLYDEALKLYRKTLASQEQRVGPEHPSTLHTIHDIGSVLRCQRRYDEALAQYQIALKGREKLFGENHPDTLVSIYRTGLVLLDQKKYAESLQFFYRALAGLEALGQNHSLTSIGTADVMERIALVFVNQEKYKEALKWCSRSLETREKTLGKDHPTTITAAKTVANCKKTISYQKGCIIT
ncbi:hypothetical protein TWF751_010541 [Orbilia oligospora]|nr:hypothetical protein TWF751_010541 [Orbilia oligospora]